MVSLTSARVKSECVVKNTHILLTVTLRELQLYSLVGTRAQIPMHCSNRDRNVFFLSVIEATSQGSFNRAQNNALNVSADSGQKASIRKA